MSMHFPRIRNNVWNCMTGEHIPPNPTKSFSMFPFVIRRAPHRATHTSSSSYRFKCHLAMHLLSRGSLNPGYLLLRSKESSSYVSCFQCSLSAFSMVSSYLIGTSMALTAKSLKPSDSVFNLLYLREGGRKLSMSTSFSSLVLSSLSKLVFADLRSSDTSNLLCTSFASLYH